MAEFTFDLSGIQDNLLTFATESRRVSGMLQAIPDNVQIETIIQTMVAEAVKTSEIEGEYLSRQDVVAAIRNHLGINPVA